MSSKQRSIKDHFRPLKSNELAEIEPNLYPHFQSKAVANKTNKTNKTNKRKPKPWLLPEATKIRPPQTVAAGAIAPNSQAMKSIFAATEIIQNGSRTKEATQTLDSIIATYTTQFYLNQKRRREQNQPSSQPRQSQPINCSQPLSMEEIEHKMNAYHSIDWKQDRCCRVLFGRIPDIRMADNRRIMWRDKYRPDTVEGLLGYFPDYEYLRDWLNQLKIKSPTVLPETAVKKIKKSARKDDKEAIYNLMLFVGGHGLGKTAAVYTAAKEAGYSVFEINSSARRSGRDVTDSVGEMTESHLVRFCSNTNKRKPPREIIILRDTVKPKKPKTIDIAQHFKKMLIMQSSNGQVQDPAVEPTLPAAETDPPLLPLPSPPQKNTLEAFFKKAKEKQDLRLEEIANQPKQSLLLFEEVDILFEEDKGFWPAIIELCQKSKRPIIMTCNDETKVPFDFLNIQSTVYFEKAMTQEDQARFIQYVQLICYAENYSIPKREISYLCELCEYDTRKIIDMLQFWLNETSTDRNGHLVYRCLFAHIMGFSNSLFARDYMQLMDGLKGSSSKTIEICTRYYHEYMLEQEDAQQEQEVMRIQDLTQAIENACFADAWIGLNNKHRHQLYDIDQYKSLHDGYHGNDTRMICKNAADLDHWELGEIMDNSITVMNIATIIKRKGWRNQLSYWENLCYTRQLYSVDCLIACKHIIQQQNNPELIMSQYMPYIRSLAMYDQGVAGKGRTARTRKRQRYLQLSDESRDIINWQQHTTM
ncbi:P-loop containing nucleoside triphosphate hydrolase protein [Parasitella parasitica]|nr:P-loop containing nucleoside triphosphate hydrolase protein [Parasitella parasitica]